ncbi:MAG: VanZ family protein [Anaerolineales bacterium]|nr:VanZ family protein [Anaerolineales bacterium]
MKMKFTLKSFWPAIAALIVATVLLLLPGKEFPKEDWFSKIYLDKWIHLGLFAGLVILWSLPFVHRIADGTRLRNIFLLTTMGFIVYGIAIEFVQGNFIPYRSFGVDDIVADVIGSGIGLLIARRQLPN